MASLNLASVNVATSTDNGTSFSQTPVQGGLPVDDREWIAAFGAQTSLLTFHDVATNNIDVLRSDNAGAAYTQIARAIPVGDYKETNNELGNLVIDHRNLPDQTGDFYAYQSFVAPSKSGGTHNNEAFLAVSADGGHTWTDRPIPCSIATASSDLNHNFPNISVDPAGNVWYAWSNDHTIRTAKSSDHGSTWTCSGTVSTGSAQAIFPWLAATSGGVDLVYYGAPTKKNQTFYVDFVQNPTGTPSGWGTPQRLVAVHKGSVCEEGATCTTGRQLFDDFGVDTDSHGWAHIAYSHDSPNLGGEGTYTGSARSSQSSCPHGGYEVILVARRKDRLAQLADALAGPAHVVECDLASDATSLHGKVQASGLEVDLLVNNAGFGTYGRFPGIDAAREAEEVRVNCEALVTLMLVVPRASASSDAAAA